MEREGELNGLEGVTACTHAGFEQNKGTLRDEAMKSRSRCQRRAAVDEALPVPTAEQYSYSPQFWRERSERKKREEEKGERVDC